MAARRQRQNRRRYVEGSELRWAVHDNGDGWYTAAAGGTTTQHDSNKGQQGDRMHDHFNGRHDDNKGQQGNRRRDNEGRNLRERPRDDEGSGDATISSGAMMKATAARRRRQNWRCNDEGSGGTSMKLAAA